MITDYLVELHGELRMPRRRRARALAEVEDHLLCAAAELRSRGMALEEAETRAVEAFGDPGELGRALSAVEDQRRAVRSGWLAAPLGCAAAWLGLRGVVGLGAPLFVALPAFFLAQVAFVAGGLTGVRVWLARRGRNPSALPYVRRGSALVTGCALALAPLAAMTVQAHGTRLTLVALAAGAVSLGLIVAGCMALRRSSRDAIPPALAEDHDLLVELASLVPATVLDRVERWLGPRRRPWRFATIVSLAAGLTLAAGHTVAEGGPDPAHITGAIVAGAVLLGIETLCALAGYGLLGRWLGIRPRRTERRVSISPPAS